MQDEQGKAREIIDELFVNGQGQRAHRLVLVDADNHDLGGWGEEPAFNAIRRALQRPSADPVPSPAPQEVCSNPEDCCRELTRVWSALGVNGYNGKSASENVAALKANVLPSPAPALVGRPDYSKQTIVQFTIEPPIDEARWKALHAAAQAAGAVSGHINPPALVGRDQIAQVIAEMRANVISPDDGSAVWTWRIEEWADQLAALIASPPPEQHD